MPACAATTAPFESVLRSVDERPVIARLVVVACEVVARFAVKFWRVVEASAKMLVVEIPPFALKRPPRLRMLEIVVDPVTASAVEVAPTAVSPPLNASCVVVALPTNGYRMVLVITPVEELYAIPVPPESDDDEILLLKVFQSAEVSLPVFAADADGRLKMICEPLLVIAKSEPVVEVAKVTAAFDVVAKPVPIEVIAVAR